jgi:hypothetical protein
MDANHRTRLASLTVGLVAGICLLAAGSASAAPSYVASGGSDGSSCTQVAPCASIGRAYQVSAPGQIVFVAAGQYPSQTIPNIGRSGVPVVIQAAPGTRPRFSGLNIDGDSVSVRGIATGFVDIGGASNVAVVGGEGNGLFIGGGSSNVTIQGGSYGGGKPDVAPVKVQGSPAPTGITFDGVIFHDAVRQTEGAHLECIYAADVQRFTVRRSQFRNCAIMDLFLTKLSGVDPRDVLIENNFFDATGSHSNSLSRGYYSLMVANHIGNASNFTIRNNSFGQAMALDAGSFAATRVVGNVGPQSDCRSGVSYGYNVWTSVRCAGTDKRAASGFVNPRGYDYHLRPGAAAVDAGAPSDSPSVDIDGQRRPYAGGPDAGADEVAPPGSGPGSGPGGGTPGGSGHKATRTRLRVKRVQSTRRTWRLYGTVTGARAGRVRLTISRRTNKGWRVYVVKHARIGAKGGYSRRVVLKRKGRYRVRAAYPGSLTTASSRSGTTVLRVRR